MSRLAVALCLCLLAAVGCASKSGPTNSGFLPDYSRLKPVEGNPDAKIWAAPRFSLADYDRVIIDPVQLHLPPDKTKVKDEELKELQALTVYFRDALIHALQARYPMTDLPGPRTLRIRAAITDVVKAKPMRNVMTSVLPVGIVLNLGSEVFAGKGMGVAEVAIEVEVLDSLSGASQAAFTGRKTGHKYDVKGATELGQVKKALEEWAEQLRKRFDQAHGLAGAK
jgi:hypothetical protein